MSPQAEALYLPVGGTCKRCVCAEDEKFYILLPGNKAEHMQQGIHVVA